MAEQFIGAGLAFPMQVDATGGIALVRREREIEESIRLILTTAPGERPMRPEFGCGIHDFVFAPADSSTAGQIAYEVRTALERWEPRIDVAEVEYPSTTEKGSQSQKSSITPSQSLSRPSQTSILGSTAPSQLLHVPSCQQVSVPTVHSPTPLCDESPGKQSTEVPGVHVGPELGSM